MRRWRGDLAGGRVCAAGRSGGLPLDEYGGRHFSQRVVRDYGGRLVRINPREAGVGSALDVGLACEALAGLVAIDRVLRA